MILWNDWNYECFDLCFNKARYSVNATVPGATDISTTCALLSIITKDLWQLLATVNARHIDSTATVMTPENRHNDIESHFFTFYETTVIWMYGMQNTSCSFWAQWRGWFCFYILTLSVDGGYRNWDGASRHSYTTSLEPAPQRRSRQPQSWPWFQHPQLARCLYNSCTW